MLYIVPTPIGNLKDITYRAIEVLKEVSFILAEDTRVTKRLLTHYAITTPLKSFHAHNEHKVLERYIETLQSEESIALVSDAGTPAISDPGFLLARKCAELNIEMTCLPGATAFVPALVMSGLPCEKFVYEGFLPQKKGRQTRLKIIAAETRTVVLYESPHRIVKCLNQLIEHCGEDRKVAVVREISKMFEQAVRGTLKEAAQHFEQTKPKGEFVVVLEALDVKGNKSQFI
ncbi:UNVERIFIED_CONTAM: hypothetical protein GTU68_031542 [Idotea baltica]|nr:hypothetical protein [Idotea baltica]